jgi:Trk K+ transport system NAD-binding subunit
VIDQFSPVVGCRLDSLPGGAHVLALGPGDGTFVDRPAADTVIGAGDVLIVAGTEDELAELLRAVGPLPGSAPSPA